MGKFKANEGGGWSAEIGEETVEIKSEDDLVELLSKGRGYDKGRDEFAKERETFTAEQEEFKTAREAFTEKEGVLKAYNENFGELYDAVQSLDEDERKKRLDAALSVLKEGASDTTGTSDDPWNLKELFADTSGISKEDLDKKLTEISASFDSRVQSTVDGFAVDDKVRASMALERTRDAFDRELDAAGVTGETLRSDLYYDGVGRAQKDPDFTLKKIPEIVAAVLKDRMDEFDTIRKAHEEKKEAEDALAQRKFGSDLRGLEKKLGEEMGKAVDPLSPEGRRAQLAYLQAVKASRRA